MEHEEKVIFPYVRQIQHAYQYSEPYAGLFVKTLRKPIEFIMEQEHETSVNDLLQLRKLTNNYTPPLNACLTHKVVFSKLKEIDSDISRHIYLENEILFPQVVEMENKLTIK
jgi:regulator of cell morphogenesis and NO signaling